MLINNSPYGNRKATVENILFSPSASPAFALTDVLSVNIQKCSALLAFLNTAHFWSDSSEYGFKIKKSLLKIRRDLLNLAAPTGIEPMLTE